MYGWISRQLRPMRVGQIHLYSPGLTPQQQGDTGVQISHSLARTIAECITRHNDPRVAFVPEGPYVIPRLELAGQR